MVAAQFTVSLQQTRHKKPDAGFFNEDIASVLHANKGIVWLKTNHTGTVIVFMTKLQVMILIAICERAKLGLPWLPLETVLSLSHLTFVSCRLSKSDKGSGKVSGKKL